MKTRSNAGADEALAPSALSAKGLSGFGSVGGAAAVGRSPIIGAPAPVALPVRAYESQKGGDELPSSPDTDQDSGDLPGGVDEDALDSDELDTDRVTRTEALVAKLRLEAMRQGAEILHGHPPK